MSNKTIKRVIISGGGTGGHIFPAIAIADEIKKRNPMADILFVGATGKMEMEKVPDAGYKIIGLEIVGLKRKLALSNFLLPYKIIKSIRKARKIIKEFNPQVVVGLGGYASGPTLKAATMLKIPSLVQEQNSFPGKTNKLLAKKVQRICVAYDGLDRFFPKEKIIFTGNPTRAEMVQIDGKREEAYKHYQLDPNKKTILIIGGSLGARTLNESLVYNLSDIPDDVQVLWQCGKLYFDKLESEVGNELPSNVIMMQFIKRMDLAYSAADIIISRAGAISVSELCLIKKTVILVPSPNVAEDHQTKNAMALVNMDAALLIRDVDAKETLLKAAWELMNDPERQRVMSANIALLGRPHATSEIVNTLEELI